MSTSSIQDSQLFLFQIPQVEKSLSEAAVATIQMGGLASRQTSILRTRTHHPDGRDENVAEHSLMLAKVAPELAEMLYPKLDANLISRYATMHDDVEAYVGDTPTDIMAEHDPAAKAALEATGLQQLLTEYAHMPKYVQLIGQYESQSTPEARFVRAVDKLMVLLIHIPNKCATLMRHYDRESFIRNELKAMERDAYKYGEFDKILALRKEIGLALVDIYFK